MSVLGSLLAIGFALAFGVVAVLVIWGSAIALQQEVVRGFESVPASGSGKAMTLLGLALPLLGAAVLAALSAVRIFAVALGSG